ANKEDIFLNNPYVIRLATTPEEEFETTATLLNKNATGSLQVFAHPHSYSTLWGNEILNRYNSSEKKLTNLPSSLKDYDTVLLEAKDIQVKNLAICLNSGSYGTFIKQLEKLDYSAKVFSCNALESSADITAIKDYPQPIYYFSSALNDSFLKSYQTSNKLGGHIVSIAMMYDISKILASVINNNSKEDLTKQILATGSYNGAHSESKVMKTIDDQFLSIPFALFQIKQGKISQIQD
ncbi:MAG: hypothetical protein WD512_09760, partial [Candidatus Paceibacterota bacterium]